MYGLRITGCRCLAVFYFIFLFIHLGDPPPATLHVCLRPTRPYYGFCWFRVKGGHVLIGTSWNYPPTPTAFLASGPLHFFLPWTVSKMPSNPTYSLTSGYMKCQSATHVRPVKKSFEGDCCMFYVNIHMYLDALFNPLPLTPQQAKLQAAFDCSSPVSVSLYV